MKQLICTLILLLLTSIYVQAQEGLPCQGTTTAVLNVRSGPGKSFRRIDQLKNGTKVKVVEKADKEWVLIEYGSKRGYVSSNYLKFSSLPSSKTTQSGSTGFRVKQSLWEIVVTLLTWGVGLLLLYLGFKLLVKIFFITARCLTIVFQLVSLPFFLANALQRYLAKPWILFFKQNRFSNHTNEVLRIIFSIIKIPLYIALTPLRLANALFFNIAVHCTFEMFNYIMEVIYPSSWKEGGGSYFRWPLMLPWRILKYPLWHGSLTIIESTIWTAIDIFLPALTLFHGTATEAADCIVASPGRGKWRPGDVGIWRVGSGNYAGNGIYFAPARSTAEHYSSGSLIICRVTLGSTIDLGLAPYHVYRECGHPNAYAATRWGLENGFATGEWWRPDEGWWEYCMYDWQNRYNFSWRIRPLYVINLDDRNIQRIHGGMCHWLFRRMVIEDIMTSLE